MHIVGELHRHLPISQPAVPLFGYAPPGRQVHLVYRNRRVQGILLLPARHPVIVPPRISAQIPHARGRLRPDFGGIAVGVGFIHLITVVPRSDVVLVQRARSDIGNERLPHPRFGLAAAWDGSADSIRCDLRSPRRARRWAPIPRNERRGGHPFHLDARRVSRKREDACPRRRDTGRNRSTKEFAWKLPCLPLEVVIEVPLRPDPFANFHDMRGQALRRQLKIIAGAAP